MTTTTNNIPRPILYAYELTDKERAELDYIEDINSPDCMETFFRYKGHVYHLGDCMVVEPNNELCKGWDGYFGETFFSAVVVKYTDDCQSVIVGRVYC